MLILFLLYCLFTNIFRKFAPRCCVCHNPIMPELIILLVYLYFQEICPTLLCVSQSCHARTYYTACLLIFSGNLPHVAVCVTILSCQNLLYCLFTYIFRKFAPRCCVCHNPVMPELIILLVYLYFQEICPTLLCVSQSCHARTYYTACLLIFSGNLPHVAVCVTILSCQNLLYCLFTYIFRKFAPRCCVCHNPIMPERGQEETVRVVAMDRSFHVQCYRCEVGSNKILTIPTSR